MINVLLMNVCICVQGLSLADDAFCVVKKMASEAEAWLHNEITNYNHRSTMISEEVLAINVIIIIM